jgi:hypothetical protein
VLRAFTSAAYAFAAGARRIWLVRSVDEALAMKAQHPGLLAMGEDLGRRVPGFDFANSPAELARADLDGREWRPGPTRSTSRWRRAGPRPGWSSLPGDGAAGSSA